MKVQWRFNESPFAALLAIANINVRIASHLYLERRLYTVDSTGIDHVARTNESVQGGLAV